MILRPQRFGPGVRDDETARAIGTFRHTLRQSGLADERGLLIARHTEHWQGAVEQGCLGRAEIGRTIEHFG